MIRSFGDQATRELYHGLRTARVRGLPGDVLRVALRKLDMLEAATRLDDLKSPPGNRLEALKGDWSGHFSIRVNNQWRLVFKWDEGAHQVRLVDYH